MVYRVCKPLITSVGALGAEPNGIPAHEKKHHSLWSLPGACARRKIIAKKKHMSSAHEKHLPFQALARACARRTVNPRSNSRALMAYGLAKRPRSATPYAICNLARPFRMPNCLSQPTSFDDLVSARPFQEAERPPQTTSFLARPFQGAHWPPQNHLVLRSRFGEAISGGQWAP